jgi:CubicO group peptidase (beta-lactamase class C family)
VRPDTIYRIYSMTKPLTSTAIMMLYEEGRFQLDEPDLALHPGLRQFARLCRRQPRQARYRPGRARYHLPRPAQPHLGPDLRLHGGDTGRRALSLEERNRLPDRDDQPEEVVEKLATFPLIAQPGKAWNYSVSTDVLGYLVEVISGQPFEKYLVEKVDKPLGMVDTDFLCLTPSTTASPPTTRPAPAASSR